MSSVSGGQFQKLSPQDQEKVMAEIMESCRQTRSRLKDTIAQAQACAAGNDHRRAEACPISALERGRELCTNGEGMLLTHLVGIACQKSALNEMTAPSDHLPVGIHQALDALVPVEGRAVIFPDMDTQNLAFSPQASAHVADGST
jgi:hypothetical protein